MASNGKFIADKQYIHVSALDALEDTAKVLVAEAQLISGRVIESDFNVIRIRRDHDEVAFLQYPRFFDDPFPTLTQSWRVHVPSRLIGYRSYSRSLNPPILHRKELLLDNSHPHRERFARVTAVAESVGLFDDPRKIGFLASWTDLVALKGYRVDNDQLVPIGNAETDSSAASSSNVETFTGVQRHLTALTRTSLSAPVQSLLRHELLCKDTSFFDYGCGKGDDLAALATLGIAGGGWDPYFRPNAPRTEADAVNIGFVINVIEDLDERIEALANAYKLSRQVLAVSAMLQSTGYSGRTFRDGVLTGRNTFQKYYSQAELQQFIESVLDETATPVAPGVFYVFRDRALEYRFHTARSTSRTRVLRAALPIRVPRAPRPQKPTGVPHTVRHRAASQRSPRTPDPALVALSSRLWQQCLELGRIPEQGELEDSGLFLGAFGSLGRAIRLCLRWNDVSALERSASARRDELRVLFALQIFSRRRRFRDFDRRLQLDVKAFFGSLANAEVEGRRLLYSTRDVDLITAACEEAAGLGLGWLEPGQALHLHTSLVEQLPPILRVYVGCATIMFGDITQMDLAKLHLQSGKVSLMRFDDFVGRALPRMVERVKVRLRDQEVDIFSYGGVFPPPLLFCKSRFINEEFPGYAEQVALDEQLEELGLLEFEGYGPSADEFERTLSDRRWMIDGLVAKRLPTVPSLDDRCGRFFTYRRLIECGETWHQLRPNNNPIRSESYCALRDLAHYILDPVIDYFGMIVLTYGFAGRSLTKHITQGIEPRLDQHAACEHNSRGRLICERSGAAIDFLITDESMLEVARWIVANSPFDRLYYYGEDRPIHISYGPQHSRAIFSMTSSGGRRIPRRVESL